MHHCIRCQQCQNCNHFCTNLIKKESQIFFNRVEVKQDCRQNYRDYLKIRKGKELKLTSQGAEREMSLLVTMVWMFVAPKIYVLKSVHHCNGMRRMGPLGGGQMSLVSSWERPESCLAPLRVRAWQAVPSGSQGVSFSRHQPAPRTVRNSSVVVSYPDYGISLQQPRWTKTLVCFIRGLHLYAYVLFPIFMWVRAWSRV